MEGNLNDLYKEKLNVLEKNNDSYIIQSDIPPELNPDILNEKENNNNIINDSQNKNTKKSREEDKIQNVIMLSKYEKKSNSKCNTIIGYIILGMFILLLIGISIADIVIQFINPNDKNPYLIDDISMIISTILSIFKFKLRIAYLFVILIVIAFIVDTFIYFEYFDYRKPIYIREFYNTYFAIKLSIVSLLSLLFSSVFCLEICFGIVEKKEENN